MWALSVNLKASERPTSCRASQHSRQHSGPRVGCCLRLSIDLGRRELQAALSRSRIEIARGKSAPLAHVGDYLLESGMTCAPDRTSRSPRIAPSERQAQPGAQRTLISAKGAQYAAGT